MSLECHVQSRKLSGCAFHLCISNEFKWLLNIISMNLHLFVAQEYPQHLRLKNASNKTPRCSMATSIVREDLTFAYTPHMSAYQPLVSLKHGRFWNVAHHISIYAIYALYLHNMLRATHLHSPSQ